MSLESKTQLKIFYMFNKCLLNNDWYSEFMEEAKKNNTSGVLQTQKSTRLSHVAQEEF